jgi:hypothetical protein
MTKKALLLELERVSALRENRLRIAELVLQDETNFLPLLEITLNHNDHISVKAAWVFELVCTKKMTWLYNYLDVFTANIKDVHFDSAVRPLSKICQLLIIKNDKTPINNLTETHKEHIFEACFDWMISDHKVAIKAYSMYTLFLLGKQYDWIHEELKLIILKNIDSESKAYKSRGKITLEQIRKFRKKRH